MKYDHWPGIRTLLVNIKDILNDGGNANTLGHVINRKPLAGLLKVILLSVFLYIQVLDFIKRLHDAENYVVMSGNVKVKDYIKSDFGRAVIFDHSVNRPGLLRTILKMQLMMFILTTQKLALFLVIWALNT